MPVKKRTKKAKRYWMLYVGIPFEPNKKWNRFDAYLQKTLGPCTGSGAGLGFRDMDWYFKSREAADKAREKVTAAMKKKGVVLNWRPCPKNSDPYVTIAAYTENG